MAQAGGITGKPASVQISNTITIPPIPGETPAQQEARMKRVFSDEMQRTHRGGSALNGRDDHHVRWAAPQHRDDRARRGNDRDPRSGGRDHRLPIETGSSITDHVRRKPITLSMTVVLSDITDAGPVPGRSVDLVNQLYLAQSDAKVL